MVFCPNPAITSKRVLLSPFRAPGAAAAPTPRLALLSHSEMFFNDDVLWCVLSITAAAQPWAALLAHQSFQPSSLYWLRFLWIVSHPFPPLCTLPALSPISLSSASRGHLDLISWMVQALKPSQLLHSSRFWFCFCLFSCRPIHRNVERKRKPQTSQ